MKKVLIAALSICFAVMAASVPLSASAEGNVAMPEYPDDIFEYPLTFNNLTDFAVADENRMLFADGGALVYFEYQIRTEYNFDGETVTDVDYTDGNFYYSLDGGGTSFILPYPLSENLPSSSEAVEHVYPAEDDINVFESYYYYYNADGVLIVVDKNADEIAQLDNLVKAKAYGGQLYAIYKNENSETSFYKIDGADCSQINLTYSNYDKLTQISPGDLPEKLTLLNIAPDIVQINDGAFLTEVDLNNLVAYDGNGNPHLNVIAPNDTHSELIGKTALCLCEAGNVRIITCGTSAYIVKTDSTTDLTDRDDFLQPVKEDTEATVNTAGEYAHALPFMSNATRTFELAANEVVTVLYEVSDEVLAHTFYLIENSEGEQGYIAAEFLEIDLPRFDESDASNLTDPDPKNDDYIRTVVLVIVVIVLILIAAGYLTWVCTSAKTHKAAKNNADGVEPNGKNSKK